MEFLRNASSAIIGLFPWSRRAIIWRQDATASSSHIACSTPQSTTLCMLWNSLYYSTGCSIELNCHPLSCYFWPGRSSPWPSSITSLALEALASTPSLTPNLKAKQHADAARERGHRSALVQWTDKASLNTVDTPAYCFASDRQTTEKYPQ